MAVNFVDRATARFNRLPQPSSGWLVRAGDVNDLVNAIHKWQALPPESAPAMRHSALRHARDIFSEAAGLPDILKIYGRLGVRGAISETGT
jgi:glycosyltransferase involved in cell wall biosynthesis